MAGIEGGWSARQCNTAQNYLHQQKCIEHWVMLQQHKYEAFGILHGLEKFHHYHFVRELCVIIDQKLLVVICSKGVATLSQQLQCIILRIHQYRVHIIYKPGPSLIHCGLAVSKQPYREQGPGNHKDEHKFKCHQYISKYASMHINRGHTGSNIRRHSPAKAKIIYNAGLAMQEDKVEHCETLLASKKQTSCDWWHCHEE